MRIAVLSADFGLFFLLCVYLIHSVAAAKCPPGNCLSSSDKCSEVSNRVCENPGDSCCSVVKPEYATLCQHSGGICREDFCGSRLQTAATDCADNEVCCVLVV